MVFSFSLLPPFSSISSPSGNANPLFQGQETLPRGRKLDAASPRERRGDRKRPRARGERDERRAPREKREKALRKSIELSLRRFLCLHRFLPYVLLLVLLLSSFAASIVPWRCAWTPSQKREKGRGTEEEKGQRAFVAFFFFLFFRLRVRLRKENESRLRGLSLSFSSRFFSLSLSSRLHVFPRPASPLSISLFSLSGKQTKGTKKKRNPF